MADSSTTTTRTAVRCMALGQGRACRRRALSSTVRADRSGPHRDAADGQSGSMALLWRPMLLALQALIVGAVVIVVNVVGPGW